MQDLCYLLLKKLPKEMAIVSCMPQETNSGKIDLYSLCLKLNLYHLNLFFSYDTNQNSLKFMNHYELRKWIVNSIDENPHIQFDELDIDKEEWKTKMSKNFEYCDDLFICQLAKCLNRTIKIIPVFEQDWHSEMTKKVESSLPPIYYLYYPETRFESAHYQSIRPIER